MSYKDKYADGIESLFCGLENRIYDDVIRRIRKTGEITSTADWQLNRLTVFGQASAEIEDRIKNTLNLSYPEVFEMYDKVIDWEYVRNKTIYEQINGKFIPFEKNKRLQQLLEGMKRQSEDTLKNFTRSLGVVDTINGQYTFLPLTKFYQDTLDTAVMDIASGAFDYNSVLKRTVATLSKSGIRTIDYASGYSSRLPVAARRAVMTGMSQLSGKIADYNAEQLGTEHFEVAWHSGARPTHREWQGQVWTKDELVSVCGLGTVTGLLGVNCYHSYYPFIPGVSERNWTDEELEKLNAKEDELKTFKGKEYNAYDAKQMQRKMETSMRAQRLKARGLEKGGADPEDIVIAKARYQGQLAEYKQFADAMDIKPHMERVYVDGLGRTALSNKMFKIHQEDAIIKRELREIIKQGKINIPPRTMRTNNLGFDHEHINKQRNHNVSKGEAISFIENASFSVTVWKGHYERYYSHEGSAYVDIWERKIRTAYRQNEFRESIVEAMEVMKKHGR